MEIEDYKKLKAEVANGRVLDPASSIYRQLKIEDALQYLEKVKKIYGDSPKVYNQFLDVMKNFKSHVIDTPGVIQQVSDLFHGHNDLILGFNTFLPPGFQITIPVQNNPDVREVRNVEKPVMKTESVNKNEPAPMPQQRQQQIAVNTTESKPERPKVVAGTPPQAPANDQPEFDTAINYVTKIKKRFSEETGTYKTFLEILHTYQKEQRNIKQVLDDVSHLFRDHPDLLKEFTYFLPDAVQDIAKTRLAAAASRSERRLQKQRREAKRARDSVNAPVTSKTYQKPAKRPRIENVKAAAEDDETVIVGAQERRFFERVKGSLRSRTLYNEFLSLFTLHQEALVSTREFFCLTADILGGTSPLQVELKKLMKSSMDPGDEDEDETWFGLPLSSIDFSTCFKCTPSYRALPENYPAVPCSGRDMELSKMLNDRWVSVPTGSEDGFTFKNISRNVCEEALFKTEDSHYETDLVIESTMSTVRALEPILLEINKFANSNINNPNAVYKLDRKALNILQVKSIARIYGESGNEILELLNKNAMKAIPIIYQRMKQKLVEWQSTKYKLEQDWRVKMADNYYKSLDRQSPFLVANDKKNLSSRNLINEIKVAAFPQLAKEKNKDIGLPESIEGPLSTIGNPCKCHIKIEFDDREIHKDVLMLLRYTSNHLLGGAESNRVNGLWSDFMLNFMAVPTTYYLGNGPLLLDNAIENGTSVQTRYGIGVISSFTEGYVPMYQVKLNFGLAYLLPSDFTVIENENKLITPEDEEVPEENKNEEEEFEVKDKNPRIAYLNSHMYVFFRLYKVLYDRLAEAKALSTNKSLYSEYSMTRHPIEVLNVLNVKPRTASHDSYRQVLSSIFMLVSSNIDQGEFEKEIKHELGNEGFFLGTIDKLMIQIQKQMARVALEADYLPEIYKHFRKKEYVDYVSYNSAVKAKMLSERGGRSTLYRVDVIPPTKNGQSRPEMESMRWR